MQKIERVSVIGLGAIGSAYASRLADALPDDSLRVIAAGERRQRYMQYGVNVNGENYKFNTIDPAETCSPADLIIFAVKFNQLQQAIEDVRNHIGPDTIIMSLLNGITSEEIIGAAYGMNRMLYSMAVGIDAVRAGLDVHFSNIGHIAFGEAYNETHSEKVKAVKELFERAGIPYEIPLDMKRTLWWKFMINVGINQTSAVLRAPYGVFQTINEAYQLMLQAIQEVIALSQKAGINLTASDIDEWRKCLNTLSPQGKTSMLQDIEAGRKTEVEIFAGTVISLGEKYNVPTPVNKALYNIIRTQEKMPVNR